MTTFSMYNVEHDPLPLEARQRVIVEAADIMTSRVYKIDSSASSPAPLSPGKYNYVGEVPDLFGRCAATWGVCRAIELDAEFLIQSHTHSHTHIIMGNYGCEFVVLFTISLFWQSGREIHPEARENHCEFHAMNFISCGSHFYLCHHYSVSLAIGYGWLTCRITVRYKEKVSISQQTRDSHTSKQYTVSSRA